MDEKKKVVRYKLVKHKWPDEIAAEKAKRNAKMMTAAFCVVCFVLGFLASLFVNQTSSKANSTNNKLNAINEIMTEKWYFGKDKKKLPSTLSDGAINGLVNSGGDRHTVYLSEDEANSLVTSLQGTMVGIGIQYIADGTYAVIDRVFRDSPAEEAGIISGDRIAKVNGKAIAGDSADKISELIKGKAGTTVNITILRENKEVELEVGRRQVENSVMGYVKEGNIGVLEISSFAETTGTEVGKQLEAFKKQGVKQLIVDFRDNSGGYVDAAQQMASYFVPANTTMFLEESKSGVRTKFKTFKDYPLYKFSNIAVVVNNDTASAAEIMTAFFAERLNAEVVGVKTYGKGSVQTTQPFEDGSAIKYTTAQWFTSKGKKVNGVGIKPTIGVELDSALTLKISNDLKIEPVQYDSVSEACSAAQYYLKYMGYDVDRVDGYFSAKTQNALRKYQQDKGLEVTGILTKEVLISLNSSTSVYWNANKETLDIQMAKAVEVVNGK